MTVQRRALSAAPIREPSRPWLEPSLAWYFVLVWGSGFIATKIGLQYTTPLVFLSLRYALGIGCLLPLAIILRFHMPASPLEWFHIAVAGLLVHVMNLGGSHYAQYLGMSAGTTALVLAVQPLLTALIAALWMGERLIARQWAGIALGLAGVTLVVWHKIDVRAINSSSVVAVLIGLAGTTLGALYQRTFCASVDLRSASLIQFVVAFLILFPAAWAIDDLKVQWTWQLLASALFLVIGASILALNAFHFLMRRGEASRVASLLYLTPVVAVILEFLVFAVVPSPTSIVGMVIVCAGVAFTSLRKKVP